MPEIEVTPEHSADPLTRRVDQYADDAKVLGVLASVAGSLMGIWGWVL